MVQLAVDGVGLVVDELGEVHVVLDIPELPGDAAQASVVVCWLLEQLKLTRQFLNIYSIYTYPCIDKDNFIIQLLGLVNK